MNEPRIAKLQILREQSNYSSLLITNPSSIEYLTGCRVSCGLFQLNEKGGCLFVDSRYVESLSDKRNISVFDPQFRIKSDQNVAIDGNYATFDRVQVLFGRKTKIISDDLVKKIRMIKDSSEQVKIKKSLKIAENGFAFIKKQIKKGLSELQIRAQFISHILNSGAEQVSFDPIIAFDKNSRFPHHHSSSSLFKKEGLALCDLGVMNDRYCSDITKMVLVGENSEQTRILKVLEGAFDVIKEAAKIGEKVNAMDVAFREYVKKNKIDDKAHIVHSLGHSIGLEVHEYPVIGRTEEILEEGMVLSIEPALYFDHFGVRLEKMYCMTQKGLVELCNLE